MDFKINEFEGPLDLLLHLIKESKMNIMDIEIEKITEQYINYLNLQEEMNLEVASEYLVMASELIELKSKMLLPNPKNDEGEEEPYFSPKFLVVKYLKMSEADLELNDKYKLEEKLAKKAKEDTGGEDEDTGGEDEMGGEDAGDEGGSEEEGGDAGNIDDEMMGDVQPESTETTQV